MVNGLLRGALALPMGAGGTTSDQAQASYPTPRESKEGSRIATHERLPRCSLGSTAEEPRVCTTCMGLFLSSGRFGLLPFFVRSGKAVFRPVACDQVRGARGRGQGTETLAKA